MSLRETIEQAGWRISPRFSEEAYARFAPAAETVGFIDTSADLDGSRGIAFLCDRIRVKQGKAIWQAYYTDITETLLCESYESDFADELVIRSVSSEVRVSDYSLNKRELKALIDKLCAISRTMSEEVLERECSYATFEAAEHFAQQAAESDKAQNKTEENPPAEPMPANFSNGEIGEEAFGGFSEAGEIAFKDEETPAEPESSLPEQAEPLRLNIPALYEEPEDNTAAQSAGMSVDDILDELDMRAARTAVPEPVIEESGLIEADADLEEMSHEETMSYLLSSISEINTTADDGEDIDFDAISPDPAVMAALCEEPAEERHAPESAVSEPARKVEPPEREYSFPYTREPDSDDIYIKASRELRGFCEVGKLSREQITSALKDSLLPAAALFSEISADGTLIPDGLAPKVCELKAASERLPQYFGLGEDIAERVMFFMLFQMLSYSDRIAETPETKERLNDFFRRFGAAGITLSMLDMRIQ
ncbi:MAG: hypothetical protein ACI4Q4_00315 [Oscillospiraceae bacterium]